MPTDWIPAGVNPALWEALKEFHRRNPPATGHRKGPDLRDTLEDIQPFERTTTFPRGEP